MCVIIELYPLNIFNINFALLDSNVSDDFVSEQLLIVVFCFYFRRSFLCCLYLPSFPDRAAVKRKAMERAKSFKFPRAIICLIYMFINSGKLTGMSVYLYEVIFVDRIVDDAIPCRKVQII